MTNGQIKTLRTKVLRESRLMFGLRFNVSARTVESWEQGLRQPSKLVQRLMTELVKGGEYDGRTVG